MYILIYPGLVPFTNNAHHHLFTCSPPHLVVRRQSGLLLPSPVLSHFRCAVRLNNPIPLQMALWSDPSRQRTGSEFIRTRSFPGEGSDHFMPRVYLAFPLQRIKAGV